MALKSIALIKQASTRFQKKQAKALSLAQAQGMAGRYSDAERTYQTLLVAHPEEPSLLTEYGSLLIKAHSVESGLGLLEKSLQILNNQPRAWTMKGVALTLLLRFDEALDCFRRSLEIDPAFVPTYINRGRLYRAMGVMEPARKDYLKAIQLDPKIPEAHYNLGNTLRDLDQPESALDAYDAALALNPNTHKARIAKGLIKLALGRWPEALEDYAARWQLPSMGNSRSPGALALGPAHQRAGKRILVYSEQGLGDTIQFCRYAKQLADEGAEVTLAVQPELKGILGSLDPRLSIIALGEADSHPHDHDCAMLDLLSVLKASPDQIPDQRAYLSAPAEQCTLWQQRLSEDHQFRIGLVWAGGDRSHRTNEHLFVNRRRNIPLEILLTAALPGVTFYSLQKGDTAERALELQQKSVDAFPRVINLASELNDFSTTAAVIACLDLVISVDTAVAHLTGALGKNLVILNRFDSDWRWFPGGEGCSWYASGRVLRQSSYGDWESVIPQLREVISALIQKKPG